MIYSSPVLLYPHLHLLLTTVNFTFPIILHLSYYLSNLGVCETRYLHQFYVPFHNLAKTFHGVFVFASFSERLVFS